jgi:CBS domain-containing membrane protein
MPFDASRTVAQVMDGIQTDLLSGEHPIIVATPKDSLEKAVEWFTRFDVHHLPVVDSVEHRVLVGIVSTVDVLAYVTRHEDRALATIGDVMVREPDTIAPSTTLAHATQLLAEASYQCLPVVDAQGRCVGIITVRDLVKYFASRINAAREQS